MTLCTGRGAADGGHCCWVKGKVCEFLIENHEGRRWACGIMVKLGDWQTVHTSPSYRHIATIFATEGLCGDWQPPEGQCCREAR